MHIQDLQLAARVFVQMSDELLPTLKVAIAHVRDAQQSPVAAATATSALNDLVMMVGILGLSATTPGREQAWLVLGGPTWFGTYAESAMLVQLRSVGVDYAKVHDYLSEMSRNLRQSSSYAEGIALRIEEMVDGTPESPGEPRLALSFPGAFDLLKISRTTQELDIALKNVAGLAGSAQSSPRVANVDTGSLWLEVLLDPATWSVLRDIVLPIAEGMKLLAELWALRRDLASMNFPTNSVDERIALESRSLASQAVETAAVKVPRTPDHEELAKARQASMYFVEVISEGTTVRFLQSGGVEPSVHEMNERLKALQEVIARARELGAGHKQLPPPPDQK